MVTNQDTLKKMTNAIDKSLKEISVLIKSYKDGSPTSLECQGEYLGLNKIKKQVLDIENKAIDKNSIDIKAFYKLEHEIISEIINRKPVKETSYNKGYYMGLDHGRNFVNALIIAEIKREEGQKNNICQNINEQTRKGILR